MLELVERRKDRHWRVYDTEQYTIVNGRTKKLCRAVFQKGQNYKNLSTGNWEDFNGRWEYDDTTDPQGNRFGWKVKKSDAQLRIFTQNPNKKWMRIGFSPGVFVQYSLPNLEPSFSENIVLFAEAWANTDIRLTASPEGVKNDVILKAHGHPASFSFPISVTGCSAQVEGNTLVYYRDSEPIARIPAPYMEDTNGERGEVSLSYDGNAVTFTPDGERLKTAVYPVIIDPTTILQPDGTEGKDAYVRSDIPDSNLGSIAIGMYGPYLATGWGRFFLQFDLSFIVPGNTIDAATFELLQSSTSGPGTHRFEIRAVTSSWTESTIKWSNQSTFESNGYDPHVLSTSAIWVSWSIKELVQRWVNGEITNNGLCVVYSDAHPGTTAYHAAYSSDYSTATQRPKLTIDYTEGSTGTVYQGAGTAAVVTAAVLPAARRRYRSPVTWSITGAALSPARKRYGTLQTVALTEVSLTGRRIHYGYSGTVVITEATLTARAIRNRGGCTKAIIEALLAGQIYRQKIYGDVHLQTDERRPILDYEERLPLLEIQERRPILEVDQMAIKGDTVKLKATFYNFGGSPTVDADLFDPSDLVLRIYDRYHKQLGVDIAITEAYKTGTGKYEYLYTIPKDAEGDLLYYEFEGRDANNLPVACKEKLPIAWAN